MEQNDKVTWAFQRLGGMDQVTLETAGELSRLRELDPKLWAALSCPASGLEFDARTLELLDSDTDGRIRIPEVLDAMDWVCERLVDPAELAQRPEALPLASIRIDTEQGRRVAVTAANALKNLGREGEAAIRYEDVSLAATSANALLYNGDGIFPAHAELDAGKQAFVNAVIAVIGSENDASGEPGVNAAAIDAFLTALQAEKDWRKALSEAPHPLGADTPAAWSLMQGLKEKINDYFLRCRLASFAPVSTASLNAEEQLVSPGEHGLLAPEALSSLPLSRIEADAPLRLDTGLNPAWREKAKVFFSLVSPILADPASLSEEGWDALQQALAPYGAALAARPVPSSSASNPPADAAALAALCDDDIDAFLSDAAAEELKAMMAEDLAVNADSSDIAELERLVLYYRHLHRLLMNFISFHDFYSLKRPAMFQAGTLFIDGRSCRLCLPVADIAKHSAMAQLSQLCLLYCECRRRVPSGSASGDKMNIVAAMTAGSDAFLREGRNGVYVDNNGEDWDATLVKIVRNPISIKQAVWAPYLRISQMVGEQLTKFAGNTAKKVETAVTAQAKAPAAPFDISKSVGLFAAVGIALGAIGTAVGTIVGMLMALHWWQFPLLIVAAFACVSGPAAFLAWLKLRKRTLGPVLEASGWAVNGQLPINILLGRALTSEAALPGNSTRTRFDPLQQTGKAGKITAAIILAALLGIGYLGYTGTLMELLKKAVTIEQVEKPAAPAAQPEKK